MWKILAIIAAVLLGGAGYFAYDNHQVTETNMTDLAKEKKKLAGLRSDLQETNDQIAMLQQSIMMLQDETERLNTEKIDVDNKIVQVQSEQALLATQLTTKQAKLDKWREVSRTFPEIEMIRRQMKDTRMQIEESEIDITKNEGIAASTEAKTVELEGVANELVALRQDQNNGIIRGEFQSSIVKAYNRWGFVVVSGGDDQGVVHNAQLDVFRKGQYICKLLVTEVKPNQSIADIVPGSLQPGQSALPGDIVVEAIKTTTTATPAANGAAPVVAPAPAPDPAAGGVPVVMKRIHLAVVAA